MMLDLDDIADLQCCSTVGSGKLSSQIWRISKKDGTTSYAFTILKSVGLVDFASPLFEPTDLVAVLRLVRVLAQEIRHDGGCGVALNQLLDRLTQQLDVVLQAHSTCSPDDKETNI